MTVIDYSIRHRVTGLEDRETRLEDLGVLSAVDLLDSGEQVLYTPSGSEAVQVITGADSFERVDGQAIDVNTTDRLHAVTGSVAPLIHCDSNQFSPPAGLVSLSVLSVTPIVAVLVTGENAIPVLGTPGAWQALSNWSQGFLIRVADSIWSSGNGTSGASLPDFAGNDFPGATVDDGTVTFTNEGPVPTQGAIHVYAVVIPIP